MMAEGGLFSGVFDAAPLAFDALIANIPWLIAGILVGITVGILPGLGGIVGMSVLLPFIFGREAEAGIPLLIGMVAIIHTADTFPSVLLGIPGSSGSQATIVDGYPMAKRGQATRALSAAFSASLIGGLIGAAVLFFVLPIGPEILRLFGTAERLMIALLGVSMVGVLGGNRPARGILMGFAGLMLGAVGAAPVGSEFRYTFGVPYLVDRLNLAILAMGIFAIPEIIDLLAKRSAIAAQPSSIRSGSLQGIKGSIRTLRPGSRSLLGIKGSILKLRGLLQVIKNILKLVLGSGWFQGIKDTARSWFLVVRSSFIGTLVGMVPGLGGSVVDWVSYGLAKSTLRNTQNFGNGDVRGVIAPESANNAKEGGALIPTILFGIPGSGATAILLGGLFILKVPSGPDLFDTQLDTVLLIVWSLAAANVFGTILTTAITPAAGWIASINIARLAPFIFIIMVIGAYQSNNNWGDIIALFIIGVAAWLLRKAGFPMVPLLIGFVLSENIENLLSLSNQLVANWQYRPGVIIIAVIIVVILAAALRYRNASGTGNGQAGGGSHA